MPLEWGRISNGKRLFHLKGRLLSKTIIFFCFNNKLNKRNKSDCWNQ